MLEGRGPLIKILSNFLISSVTFALNARGASMSVAKACGVNNSIVNAFGDNIFAMAARGDNTLGTNAEGLRTES
ncbi:unnamed protein product [Meloidogyne enterolobii]|uniref:Uncharacterized protein n=1 Tax=Meloidogyne enterolobii TaxID=390850 RepID=A0ACB1AYF7_MELEN